MSIVGSSVLEVTAQSQPLHDLLGGEWADVFVVIKYQRDQMLDKEVLIFLQKEPKQ